MNSACSDHCSRTRIKEGYEGHLSICDLCYQEEIKKELESDIQLEILSLQEELKQAKLMNDRLEREYFEKTASLSRSENELDEMTKSYDAKIAALDYQMTGEEIKTQGIAELYRNVKKNAESAKNDKQTSEENLHKAQNEIGNLIKQKEILIETKQSLNSQLERINSKLKGSLSVEQVSKILCSTCSNKVFEASNTRNENPSILEDASVSIFPTDDKQSILESVREFKDILDYQQKNPSEKSNCLIS